MSKNGHDGEIHDDVTYTHKRLAAILGHSVEWVLANVFFPSHGRYQGVFHIKIGNTYQTTGHNYRLWIERNSECLDDDDDQPTASA